MAIGSKIMPNGKPDPNCKDCKGTGKIILFTSISECDCVKRGQGFPEFIDEITNIKNNPYTGTNPYVGIDWVQTHR